MHERANLELPPASVKTFIEDGEELAPLDVRGESEFARRHLLYALSLPLSQLELVPNALVPGRA
jgi:rhodanese-related sulfurtransferase